MKELNCYGMYVENLRMNENCYGLSAEEEKKLLEEAKKGNKTARDKLISSALFFVIKIAKSFKPSVVLSLDDFIGFGNLGLVKAIDKFSPSKGTRFITYASFWIKKEIRDSIKNYSRFVRLPQNCEEELAKVVSVMEDSYFENPYSDKVRYAAKRLNMEEKHVKELLYAGNKVSSLDEPLSDKENTSYLECFSDDRYETPDSQAEINELKVFLSEMLESLPERERYVLVERLGYDNRGVRSYACIGQELGISKEHVRTLERKALSMCRKYRNVIDYCEYCAA